MTGHSSSIIRLDRLGLGYEGKPVLSGVSAEIGKGALVALIGPNGAGKSTLLKGITGELKPLSGRIEIAGIARREIAYLPQRSEIDPDFPISVFDCVAMGLWHEIGAFGGLDAGRRAQVARALAAVGLTPFAGTLIGKLSGGQFQRALFARLLLQDASLILLDEPFHAIDAETVATLTGLIKHWHAQGRTVIAALHDLGQVRREFPETMMLARELVAFGPTGKVLTPANLSKSRHGSAAGLGFEAIDAERPATAGGHERLPA